MTKAEYLSALSAALGPIDEKTRSEILLEMNDHLDELTERHPEKSESELVAALDPPEALAAALVEEAPRASRQEGRERKGGIHIHVDGVEKDIGDLEGLRDLGVRLRRALGGMEARFTAPFDDAGSEGVEFEATPGGVSTRKVAVRVSRADLRIYGGGGALFLRATGPAAASRLEIREDGTEVTIMEVRAGMTSTNGLDAVELRIPPCIEHLEAATASGDVTIRNCDAAISATTASGDVRIEGCPDAIKVSSASGDIRIVGLSGPISARTASGDVEVQAEDADGGGGIATVSGDISLALPADADLALRARTGSGDILADGLGSRSGTIILGAGTGRLDVSSVSGDIAIRSVQR